MAGAVLPASEVAGIARAAVGTASYRQRLCPAPIFAIIRGSPHQGQLGIDPGGASDGAVPNGRRALAGVS